MISQSIKTPKTTNSYTLNRQTLWYVNVTSEKEFENIILVINPHCQVRNFSIHLNSVVVGRSAFSPNHKHFIREIIDASVLLDDKGEVYPFEIN